MEEADSSSGGRGPRTRTISSTEMSEEQLRAVIARVLQVSWTENKKGYYFSISL